MDRMEIGKENVITKYLETFYDELEPMEFYRYLFPVGSFQDKGKYKEGIYNGMIALIGADGKAKKKIVTDDLEEIRKCLDSDDFCVMRPISYVGKSAIVKNARELYALTIDLDGIRIDNEGIPIGLINLFIQIEQADRIPMPTVIVSSGTGVHLYYIFDKPIRMFSSVMKKLKPFRIQLLKLIWHESITYYSKQVQYECLNQGFRMVGTKTKRGTKTRAFWTGEKITIDDLNEFVEEEYRIDSKELLLLNRKDKEDYFKRIAVEGHSDRKEEELIETYFDEDLGIPVTIDNRYRCGETWNVNNKLYDWWLKRIKSEAKVGHRYYCLLTLSAIAKKCNVDFETLKKDAFDMIDYLDSLTDDRECNSFTEEDINAALKGYSKQNEKMTRETISMLSGIEIKPNKRNYRTRAQHIAIMNFIRDEIIYKNSNWRNMDGRPKKEYIIRNWRLENPNGTKAECIKELKGIVGRTTVYKWWDICMCTDEYH